MPLIQKVPIHSFGLGSGTDSKETSPEILGGKGSGLVYLNSIGVPVPPGFIIPCEVCVEYFEAPLVVMARIEETIKPYLAGLEKHFGYMPLLSVRSGARKSMPGMMDTILNVGLDETNAKGWVDRLGKDCVADSRRRLIEMYGSVVKGLDRKLFHGHDAKGCRDVYYAETGEAFPQAKLQLLNSIEAVFKSWNNERAKIYRKLNSIPDSWGTAVTVMAMVFGNMNDQSGTGVLFTRNPDTGENVVTGEFLPNAQGEDVVAGTKTPIPLPKMHAWNPAVYAQLLGTVKKLEKTRRDVQDVEFTIQDGQLYILQTRNAKRSARAAVRIAVEQYWEKEIEGHEIPSRLSFREYLLASSPSVDPAFKTPPAFTGLPACSGVARGKVVHSKEDAMAAKEPVVLVREETTPDDIGGMLAAVGVLTMTGGATSHAAVVARALNKPTVVGLGQSLAEFPEGSVVSICGATGRVWKEHVNVVTEKSTFLKELENILVARHGIEPSEIIYTDKTKWKDTVDAIKGACAASPRVVVDVRPINEKARSTYAAMFGMTHKTQASDVSALAHVSGKFTVLSSEALPGAAVASSDFRALVDATGPVVADLSKLEPWQQKVLSWKEKAGAGGKIITLGYTPGGKDGIYTMQEAVAAILGGSK